MAILVLHPIFTECAYVLSKRLDMPMVTEIGDQKVFIVYGAHTQADKLLQKQTDDPYIKYIILNSESHKSMFMENKFYIKLMRQNVLIDYTRLNKDYLGDLSIVSPCQHWFDFPRYVDKPDKPKKTIDILFVGSKCDRRVAVYEKLKASFPLMNIVFNFDWDCQDHTKLNELLLQAKFVLNIPFYEHNILETHRINKALSLGCQVVTLFSGDREMDRLYKPYIHQTHDLVDFFLKKRVKKLRPYEELAKEMNNRISAYMLWYIGMLN
tara:strand:+ start:2952 stop:3752 length:801 start_codon:yes stop_codon:yes gene_type:complete